MGKLSIGLLTFTDMKKVIVERNPVHTCKHCSKAFSFSRSFQSHERRRVEKSPMDVKNVIKPSVVQIPVKNMKEVIVERHLMNIRNVEKPSVLSPNFKDM